MEVEAEVLHWTAMGMRQAGGQGDYIEKRTVERLLESTHARAFQLGKEAATQEIKQLLKSAP